MCIENENLLPIFTKIEIKNTNPLMKIGDLRLIPAGTEFRSIALQLIISCKKDLIIEITNTIYGSENYCFAKIKELRNNLHGVMPTLYDITNGEIGTIDINKTLPYELLKPVFNWSYDL